MYCTNKKLEKFEKDWLDGLEYFVKRVDNIYSLDDNDLVSLWIGKIEGFREYFELGIRLNIRMGKVREFIYKRPIAIVNNTDIKFSNEFCINVQDRSSHPALDLSKSNIVIINLIKPQVYTNSDWIEIMGETDHHDSIWFIN
jgi:hypothetical protein